MITTTTTTITTTITRCRPRGAGVNALNAMLIDSHCHLDFPDFEADRDALVAHAVGLGITRMVTISTRVRQFATITRARRALGRRSTARSAPILTTPQRSRTSPLTSSWRCLRAPKLRRHRRSRAGLPLRLQRPDAQRTGFLRHRRGSASLGLPLVIHAREADDDVARDPDRGKRERRPSPSLLHCFSSGAALARTGIALGGYVSPGDRDLQKIRQNSAPLPPSCHSIACWSRPTLPIWRRNRIAAVRNEPAFVVEDGSRRWRPLRQTSLDAIAAATHRKLLSAFLQGAPRLREQPLSRHYPRLRRVYRACRGSAMIGARAIRPSRKTGGPAPRCSWSGSAPAIGRRGCWSTPGRRCAGPAARLPMSARSMASFYTHASRRPHPRHRRAPRLRPKQPAPGRRLRRRCHGGAPGAHLRVLLRHPVGRALSAHPCHAPRDAGAPGGDRRAGGRADRAVPPDPWRDRLLCLRLGGLAYSCDVSDLPAATAAALDGLDIWIVDGLRDRPHPSHFSVGEALTWIGRLKPRTPC